MAEHQMLYNCTHMATVGVEGFNLSQPTHRQCAMRYFPVTRL